MHGHTQQQAAAAVSEAKMKAPPCRWLRATLALFLLRTAIPQQQGEQALQLLWPLVNPCDAKPCQNGGECTAGTTRRKLQAGPVLQGCKRHELLGQVSQINAACCGGDDLVCRHGIPASCDTACAATFLPFFNRCELQLGKLGLDPVDYVGVVRMCHATIARARVLSTSLYRCQCQLGWGGQNCAQPVDACAEFNTCLACLPNEYCGWCRRPVVYHNHSIHGSSCVDGRVEAGANDWDCYAEYETTHCASVTVPIPRTPAVLHGPAVWRGIEVQATFIPGEWTLEFAKSTVTIKRSGSPTLRADVKYIDALNGPELFFIVSEPEASRGKIMRGKFERQPESEVTLNAYLALGPLVPGPLGKVQAVAVDDAAMSKGLGLKGQPGVRVLALSSCDRGHVRCIRHSVRASIPRDIVDIEPFYTYSCMWPV